MVATGSRYGWKVGMADDRHRLAKLGLAFGGTGASGRPRAHCSDRSPASRFSDAFLPMLKISATADRPGRAGSCCSRSSCVRCRSGSGVVAVLVGTLILLGRASLGWPERGNRLSRSVYRFPWPTLDWLERSRRRCPILDRAPFALVTIIAG